MSTSNTNKKKNDKVRPREENTAEEQPKKKQKPGQSASASEKPQTKLPEPVLPLFDEITKIDDFAIQVCVPLSGSPTKLRKTTEKPERKKYNKEELKQILSKDKDNMRVVLGVNQWNELDNNKEVAVDSINNEAIEGIKKETKHLRQKVDVIAQALTLMEASNKTFYKNMLTGIDGLKNAVEKQSEDNQTILEMLKAAFTQAKK